MKNRMSTGSSDITGSKKSTVNSRKETTPINLAFIVGNMANKRTSGKKVILLVRPNAKKKPTAITEPVRTFAREVEKENKISERQAITSTPEKVTRASGAR